MFTVAEIDPYPADRVSKPHQRILLEPLGRLIAIPYRGALIPNITLRGGVVRLTKIVVNGTVIARPQAISDALLVGQPYFPYAVHRVG